MSPFFVNHSHLFDANALVDANTGASLIASPPVTAMITVADKNTSVEISNPKSGIGIQSSLQSARQSQFFQSRAEFGDADRARVAFDAVAHRDVA